MKSRIITYTLLTKTIPEYSKRDGTLYTCSLGISPELGLIRLYPLPPVGMEKWGIYRIEVTKNKRDNRQESWKITSYARHEGWTNFTKDIEFLGYVKKEYVSSVLEKYVANSITELNEKKLSVGVLRVKDFRADWVENKKFRNINQQSLGLFEDVGIEIGKHVKYTKDSKEEELRIKFRDADGFHNLQYNEWHFYEGRRKLKTISNGINTLNDKNKDLLLIGNMLAYRNNWIGLGKFKSNKQLLIF